MLRYWLGQNSVKPSSYIELVLTNSVIKLQNTTALWVFHKVVLGVLKTAVVNSKPRNMLYRDFKNFHDKLFTCICVYGIPDCHLFENKIMTILNMHVSLKMKIIKANTTPYLSKVLRKGIMTRSVVEKNSHKNKIVSF